MAKVNAPLMSFGASGAIAKAAVYFPWKGLNAVREYVVPANPKSAAQVAQRAKLKAAVTEWHAALYTAADQVAWNKLAGIHEKIMSGFNRMILEHVTKAIAGLTWVRLRDTRIDNITAAGFQAHTKAPDNTGTAKLYYGTTKTFMPTEVAGVWDAPNTEWDFTIAGLAASTLYYFQVKNTAANKSGITGIYQVTTLAS